MDLKAILKNRLTVKKTYRVDWDLWLIRTFKKLLGRKP